MWDGEFRWESCGVWTETIFLRQCSCQASWGHWQWGLFYADLLACIFLKSIRKANLNLKVLGEEDCGHTFSGEPRACSRQAPWGILHLLHPPLRIQPCSIPASSPYSSGSICPGRWPCAFAAMKTRAAGLSRSSDFLQDRSRANLLLWVFLPSSFLELRDFPYL